MFDKKKSIFTPKITFVYIPYINTYLDGWDDKLLKNLGKMKWHYKVYL